jgi:hypothetical protein
LCNSANEDAIQVTVPCPHLGDELKFHCHAVWCELDKAMKDSDKGSLSPLGTLAFIPFITFVNELPCAARVQLLLHTIDTDSVTSSNGDRGGSPTRNSGGGGGSGGGGSISEQVLHSSTPTASKARFIAVVAGRILYIIYAHIIYIYNNRS